MKSQKETNDSNINYLFWPINLLKRLKNEQNERKKCSEKHFVKSARVGWNETSRISIWSAFIVRLRFIDFTHGRGINVKCSCIHSIDVTMPSSMDTLA